MLCHEIIFIFYPTGNKKVCGLLAQAFFITASFFRNYSNILYEHR